MTLKFPEKLKVGFQKREETYNGNLAFITYYNVDNTVKNEKSFNSWCNSKIPVVEYDNKPQTGYVLNKGIKHYGHFGNNSQKIRIYDPRGFEFEITVDNLIELTQYSDINSQEIIQECVLAWNNNQVYLVPTNSLTYKEILNVPKSNPKDIKPFEKKDVLVVGNTYATKSMPYLYYMGKVDKNDIFFTEEKIFKSVRKASIVVQISDEKKSNHDELYHILTFLSKLNVGKGTHKELKDEYKKVYVNKLMDAIDERIIKIKEDVIDSDDLAYKQRRISNTLHYAYYQVSYMMVNNRELYNYKQDSKVVDELVKLLSVEHTEEELESLKNKLRNELYNQKITLCVSNFENGYGMFSKDYRYNSGFEDIIIDAENLEELLENKEKYVKEEMFVGN